jgi:hypothetical protein
MGGSPAPTYDPSGTPAEASHAATGSVDGPGSGALFTGRSLRQRSGHGRLTRMSRDPETIQREIEQTREALAGTLDELAERTSPKRLAAIARERAIAAATSPPGMAVLGGFGVLTALLVVRRIRRSRRER